MTFADDLKAWRKLHGITQVEAAEYLRINLDLLQDWEQGRWQPGATAGPIRALMELRGKPRDAAGKRQ